LETIKASDCRTAKTLVIHLFEGYGGRGSAQLVSNSRPVKSMTLVDALEQEITGKQTWSLSDNGALNFEYHPFEIITVKVVFQ
jgi:alpha-mannosidase